MKIWGHICWGKTVLTEPFADYFHLCRNIQCTCSFWMVSSSWAPHRLGIFRKYLRGKGESVAFFCLGPFCLQLQAKGKSCVTNLLWFVWGDGFGFVGVLSDLKDFLFFHLLLISHGKNTLHGQLFHLITHLWAIEKLTSFSEACYSKVWQLFYPSSRSILVSELGFLDLKPSLTSRASSSPSHLLTVFIRLIPCIRTVLA